MLTHAFGILAGLAAVVFAAFTSHARDVMAMTVAGIGSAVLLPRPPDSAGVTFAIAALAAIGLWRPSWTTVIAAAVGFSAAAWTGLLANQGLPWTAAAIIPLSAIAASTLLNRREARFAPSLLREEGLGIVLILGFVMTIAPGIRDGLTTAAALRAEPIELPSTTLGSGALICATVCVVAGGIFSLWRRR